MSRVIVSVVVLSSFVALAQRPVIEISGANFRPMPLAVAQPQAQDDGARAAQAEFDAALSYDFAACGLFQVLDRKGFLADAKEGVTASTIQFNRWTDIGAESLVKTQLSGDGSTLKGDLRLFAVAAGREELKVSESAPASNPRQLAHKLANAVYKFYTRETGPFETHIAFTRKSASGRDVYLADWDGKNAIRITNGDVNVLPTLAPGGGVAFTSYRSKKPFLFIARGSGEPQQLVAKGSMVTGAAFSPDGKRLAVSISEGENAEIYVGAADGSGLSKVTDTKFFLNTSPSWSPDGKRLAFVSNRAGNPQIYVMGADGSNPKRLTFAGNYNTTPSWSPRGDLIAFTARDERNAFDLFTVNVDSGKITRLTQDAAGNEEPVFSPNGRLILFTSTRGGSRGLHVMTFDGNNQIALPMDKGDVNTPDWGN
ncbi:MAG: DPP IV N-terminal domain-containing protein [Myxococcaceae bacterium]